LSFLPKRIREKNRVVAVKSEILLGIHSVREAVLAGRRRVNEFLFDRRHTGPRLGELKSVAENRNIPIKNVSSGHLAGLTASDHHQGVAARVSPYPYSGLDEILSISGKEGHPAFLVLLDSMVDPHNLGAILRTALCAGVDGVVIPKNRSAAATADVSRISAGALEHIRLARVTNLVRTVENLKRKGLWIVGLSGGGAEDFYGLDLSVPLALAVGGEQKGLRPLLARHCDFLAAIPMAGPLDSLNASAAAAVALYEVRRQRGKPSGGAEIELRD
jgi:23S rRNA (guanosine2251-2'-O)-methyltransferase